MPGAGLMLIAYMAFKQPNKLRMAYLIPKDKAAWLEYLVVLAKKKTVVKYLSDKELRKVILRARPSLIRKKFNYTKDPDAPESMYWSDKQVADWVEAMGYPHLRDAFLMNCINGRKLIEVDASALNKMGLKNFDEIKKVAIEIRELLQINRPNILRAIARKVPLKLYLQQSVLSGRTYDLLTFKKFCELNGFPYEIVVTNKCSLIPCACSVLISPVHQTEHDQFKEQSSSESEGSSTDKSLANAPSVEYLVRHQVIRNRTIDRIIENLMERFWDPKYKRMYGGETDRIMQRILDEGFLELGFIDPENYTKARVEFATGVSEELVRELLRCVDVLNDMNKLREELAEDEVRPEYYDNMRLAAENFLESALPIAANFRLGYYSLESIFKEQPELVEFVDKIAEEAERKTNERVPLAELFVDHVLSEAKLRVMAHNDFPYVSLEDLRSAKNLVSSILDELLVDTSYIAHVLVSAASTHHWNINDLSMERIKNLRMKRRGIKPEDLEEQHPVSADPSPANPREDRSPSNPEATPKAMEESESEMEEIPAKRGSNSGRPSTAPAAERKESKDRKGHFDITQKQLPEGRQDDFNAHVALVMLTPSRENRAGKPRSELTTVGSKISGNPSDRHLPAHASMTSVPSRMSNFSRDFVHHRSEHELRSKILPRLRLDEENGLIYDNTDNIIGELKENGRIIMLHGNIIGHVASNGVVFSPMGGVVGKIRGHEESELLSRPHTRSGYRIGLGPIKEDSYFRQQNKGRPRPSTASPNFSQDRIRADGHQRQGLMTAPPSSTGHPGHRTSKTGLRKSTSHEDEVAELIAHWSSSHSIHGADPRKGHRPSVKEQNMHGNHGKSNSVPAEWIYDTESKQEIHPKERISQQNLGVQRSNDGQQTIQGDQGIQHKDGMHPRPNTAGAYPVSGPQSFQHDADQVHTTADGLQVLTTLEGHQILRNADGVQTFRSADGLEGLTTPEGNQLFTADEGRPIFKTTDGRHVFTNVEGHQIFIKAEELQVVTTPDGRHVFKNAEGRPVYGTANASQIFTTTDGRQINTSGERPQKLNQHQGLHQTPSTVGANRHSLPHGRQRPSQTEGLHPRPNTAMIYYPGPNRASHSNHHGADGAYPSQDFNSAYARPSLMSLNTHSSWKLLERPGSRAGAHPGIQARQSGAGIHHPGDHHSNSASNEFPHGHPGGKPHHVFHPGDLIHGKPPIHVHGLQPRHSAIGVHPSHPSMTGAHGRKSAYGIHKAAFGPTNFETQARELTEVERKNLWEKVYSGEARKVVGANGLTIGEIMNDGLLLGDNGKLLGQIQQSGTLVHQTGEVFTNAVTVTRNDGVIVGKFGPNGKIRVLEEHDHVIIGKVEKDGTLLAKNMAPFGQLLNDGRIFGTNGIELGTLSAGRELVGVNGVPFGFIAEDGMIRKLDIIPQRVFHHHPKQIELLLRPHSPEIIMSGANFPKHSVTTVPHKIKAHESKHIHQHQSEEGSRASRAYNLGDQTKYNALLGNQQRQHLEGVHEVRKIVVSKDNTRLSSVQDATEAKSPTNSIDGNAPDAIQQKKLHRREMVQRWAQDLEENARAKDVGAGVPEMEAQQRQIRMAADEIVSDVLQMALTHLLLQAEAGQDTVNVLKALKKIQLRTTSKDHDPTGKSQILWHPNIRANKNIADLTTDAVKFAAKDKVMKTLKEGVKLLIKNRNRLHSEFY